MTCPVCGAHVAVLIPRWWEDDYVCAGCWHLGLQLYPEAAAMAPSGPRLQQVEALALLEHLGVVTGSCAAPGSH